MKKAHRRCAQATMSKALLRFIAWLLIPCLVRQEALASLLLQNSGFFSQPFCVYSHSTFRIQALAERPFAELSAPVRLSTVVELERFPLMDQRLNADDVNVSDIEKRIDVGKFETAQIMRLLALVLNPQVGRTPYLSAAKHIFTSWRHKPHTLISRRPPLMGDHEIDNEILEANKNMRQGFWMDGREAYYAAVYRLIARKDAILGSVQVKAFRKLLDRLVELNWAMGVDFSDYSFSTSTCPKRLAPVQDFVAELVKRKLKTETKRPLIFYDVGIGGDGAPTFFDLIKKIWWAKLRLRHIIGIDVREHVLEDARTALAEERYPKTVSIDLENVPDFELSRLRGKGYPPADLITTSNVLQHYKNGPARAAAIIRMAQALDPASPVGLLVETSGPNSMDRWGIRIYNAEAQLLDNFELCAVAPSGNSSMSYRTSQSHLQLPFPYPGPLHVKATRYLLEKAV